MTGATRQGVAVPLTHTAYPETDLPQRLIQTRRFQKIDCISNRESTSHHQDEEALRCPEKEPCRRARQKSPVDEPGRRALQKCPSSSSSSSSSSSLNSSSSSPTRGRPELHERMLIMDEHRSMAATQSPSPPFLLDSPNAPSKLPALSIHIPFDTFTSLPVPSTVHFLFRISPVYIYCNPSNITKPRNTRRTTRLSL